MTDLLGAIEASHLATTLRGSMWVYPLVNAGHVIASRCCSAPSRRWTFD